MKHNNIKKRIAALLCSLAVTVPTAANLTQTATNSLKGVPSNQVPTNQQGANISDVLSYFNYYKTNHNPNFYSTYFDATSNNFSLENSVLSKIRNGRAVYFATQYGNVYHAVLCVGYREYSDGKYRFKIYDPATLSDNDGIYWTNTYNESDCTYTLPDDSTLPYGTVTLIEGFTAAPY